MHFIFLTNSMFSVFASPWPLFCLIPSCGSFSSMLPLNLRAIEGFLKHSWICYPLWLAMSTVNCFLRSAIHPKVIPYQSISWKSLSWSKIYNAFGKLRKWEWILNPKNQSKQLNFKMQKIWKTTFKISYMTFHIFNYALNSHLVNVLSHRNNYHYSEKVVA